MILRLGQVHFPEVSGLAGDHSERCAWDLARSVSLDADLKRKEDCYYVAGRESEIADELTSCLNGRFFRE